MSETLQPLGQWDTAIDKDGDRWVSPDGLGWAKFFRRGHGVTFHPRDVAAYGLARTPISTELESLRAEVARLRSEAALQGSVVKREARTEYVTRDELAEKLDEVYQAIRDAYAYSESPEEPGAPQEPTGLAAVVRDIDGDHWARTRGGRWLALVPGGGKRTWDEVTKYGPLTVVFEGVES